MSIARMLRLRNLSSLPAELCSEIGIAQQQPDAIGQLSRVLRFEEQAGYAIPDQLWYSPYT